MKTIPLLKHQTTFHFSRRFLIVVALAVLQLSHLQSVSANAVVNEKIKAPKIQLAIILDTSNSMDGLIDQTRNQLWQVVNQFSTAKQNGATPVLEIALFEYGNDNNPASVGFVRMLNKFTRELDQVSEGLFSLATNGGSEYSGLAIKTVVNRLQWSRSNTDIKTIFIAGNEAFTQGPVNYQDAIRLAEQYGISINTIHAGDRQDGITDGWQSAALMAGGEYMSIDADQKVVHIVAPQDEKIAKLNTQLNQTYIPYGKNGANKAQRQMEQDAFSSGISAGLLAKRAKSKSSSFYSNSSWDLVDALKDGEVDEEALTEIEVEALPEPMKTLSPKQKIEYVHAKAREREVIKQEISDLSRLRASFVAEAKHDQVAASPSISDALVNAVKKQAKEKSFVFEK